MNQHFKAKLFITY